MSRLAAVVALLLSARAAHAAPITFVEQRKSFMVFDDDGTVENNNWFSREGFFTGYYPIEDGFLAVHPDDSQFIVVYSTFSLVEGVGAFFQSLANDVQGIGYAQAAELDPVIPAEFFDDTPNSQFIGMLHMNDWRNFILDGTTDLDETWISLVFGQELGHAWLAFPFIDQGQGKSDVMLGRSKAHWSFYMHTNGSPVEGHRWTDNNDGTFTAAKLDQFEFSDLDLYLMGLMDPKEVAPWFVIEDPHDCVDSQLPNKECPPPGAFRFTAPSFTVSGDRRDVTIDDIIAAEGPRLPAYPDAPNEFSLSFLLIKRPDEVLCDEEYALIDKVVERSIEVWNGQTRGRATIINRTSTDDPLPPGVLCDETGTSTGDATTGAPTTSDGGSDSSTSSSTTEAGTTTMESPTTGEIGGQDESKGCGCHSDRRDSSPLLLLLALAALPRRRARA